MKIKPEHIEHMRQAITPLKGMIESHRAFLASDSRVKDLEKRLRWDLMYAANLNQWLCQTLYEYANDVHIDTALKAIVAELTAN